MYNDLISQCPWTGWDVERGEILDTVTGPKQMIIRNDTRQLVNFFSVKSSIRTNRQVQNLAERIGKCMEWRVDSIDLGTKVAFTITQPTDNGSVVVLTNDVVNLNTPRPWIYELRDGVIWPTSQYYDSVPRYSGDDDSFVEQVFQLIRNRADFLFNNIRSIENEEIPKIITKISVEAGRSKITAQMTRRIEDICDRLEPGRSTTDKRLLKAIGEYVDTHTAVRPKRVSVAAAALNHILFDCGAAMKCAALKYLVG